MLLNLGNLVAGGQAHTACPFLALLGVRLLTAVVGSVARFNHNSAFCFLGAILVGLVLSVKIGLALVHLVEGQLAKRASVSGTSLLLPTLLLRTTILYEHRLLGRLL